LDDIERFLKGDRALDVPLLEQLIDGGAIVVGTLTYDNNDAFATTLATRIASRANGNFLVAKLAADNIASRPLSEALSGDFARETLDNAAIYTLTRSLDKVVDLDRSAATRLLGVLARENRPLTGEELFKMSFADGVHTDGWSAFESLLRKVHASGLIKDVVGGSSRKFHISDEHVGGLLRRSAF
jgi:hypothetical protein